jgi:hypothetical protein
VLFPVGLALCSAMGKTDKQKRAEQARAAASAGGSQKAANVAAAAGLAGLGAGAGEVRACAASQTSPSNGSPLLTQAHAAAPAGGSQTATYAAAAGGLAGFDAGAGAVRARAALNGYVHGSLLPTQAVSWGAPDKRFSLMQVLPREGGGALVHGLELSCGGRLLLQPLPRAPPRLRSPPRGYQLLARFCRLRCRLVACLALRLGAVFHL